VIGAQHLSTPIGPDPPRQLHLFAATDAALVFVLFCCFAAAALRCGSINCWRWSRNRIRNRSRVRVAYLAARRCWALLAATLAPSMRARIDTIVAQDFIRAYVACCADGVSGCGRRLSLQSREGPRLQCVFDALASGDIDVYVDYSSRCGPTSFSRTGIKPRQELLADLKQLWRSRRSLLLWLTSDSKRLCLVMPKKPPSACGLSIADLASRAGTMSRCGTLISHAGRGRIAKGIAFSSAAAADAPDFHVRPRRLRESR